MFRINRPRLGQTHNRVVKRCRKEQGLTLTLMGSLINNATYVGNKTHIQHSVGFINDQSFDLAQVHMAPLEKVD